MPPLSMSGDEIQSYKDELYRLVKAATEASYVTGLWDNPVTKREKLIWCGISRHSSVRCWISLSKGGGFNPQT